MNIKLNTVEIDLILLTDGWFDWFGIEIDPFTQNPCEFYSTEIAGNKYHSLYKGSNPQCLMADEKDTEIQKIKYVHELQDLLNNETKKHNI